MDAADFVPGYVSPEDEISTRLTNTAIGGKGASALQTQNSKATVENPNEDERVFECCWDVPDTLAELEQAADWHRTRPTGRDIHCLLANYMVLVGDGVHFSYSTAEEHLERLYGGPGLAALWMLGAAVSRTRFSGKIAHTADESDFPFESKSEIKFGLETHIHFRLLPEPSERRDRLEHALRWLCAAVRRHPYSFRSDAPFYWDFIGSSVAEKRIKANGETYYGMPSWRMLPVPLLPPKASCWTKLFAKCVIMESPIQRTWGQGLETSFCMMVTLAGVENMYQINGGIILLGFFTALVPISQHPETNSIQWHLETNDSGIDPQRLECTKENWFRTTDKSMLKEARCFIGWFEKAHIMLGTRQLVTDEARKLRWTGLKSRKQTLTPVGHEIGVQGGFSIGPINFVGQGVSTFAITSNKLRHTAPQQFARMFRLDSWEVSLVVDSESRRAWLVPLLSWILHLCHRYYVEHCGHCDTPIPFAEPSSDGAKAALFAVEDKGSTVVFRAGTEDAETLRQLWLRIRTNLREPQPGHEDPRKGLIFAAEAMDITMSKDSYPKEVPISWTSTSWAEFAKLATTTTVCANLGNAIAPKPPSGRLCECCVLLEGQGFLAAHTWSLARLLELKGRSFSQLEKEGLPFENGTYWRVGGGLQGLRTECPAGDDCRNIWGANASESPILQRLEKLDCQRSKGKDVDEEPPVSDNQAFEAGVVVFGGHSESRGVVSMPGLLKSFGARFGSLELFSQPSVAGN